MLAPRHSVQRHSSKWPSSGHKEKCVLTVFAKLCNFYIVLVWWLSFARVSFGISFWWGSSLKYFYGKNHSDEYRYDKCQPNEYHSAQYCLAECHFAKWHSSLCYFADCHFDLSFCCHSRKRHSARFILLSLTELGVIQQNVILLNVMAPNCCGNPCLGTCCLIECSCFLRQTVRPDLRKKN